MNRFGKIIFTVIPASMMAIGALATKGYTSLFLIALSFFFWYLFARSISNPNKRKRDQQREFQEFTKWKSTRKNKS